jgi:hypothetical protein
MPDKSLEEQITDKLSKCLDFNCQQLGASFADALGALSVVTGCLIHSNSKDARSELSAAFSKALDSILASMDKDEAVELN